jgi:hypothetical protein
LQTTATCIINIGDVNDNLPTFTLTSVSIWYLRRKLCNPVVIAKKAMCLSMPHDCKWNTPRDITVCCQSLKSYEHGTLEIRWTGHTSNGDLFFWGLTNENFCFFFSF